MTLGGTARLLTASATTGWTDWIHGQLWLLDEGLLRVRTDLATTMRHGSAPTVPTETPVTADLTPEAAELEASRHRRSVWVPREQIASAVLRGGLLTDSLRLRRHDGGTVTLLWLRQDAAYGPLKESLGTWLGPGLQLKGRRRVPEPPEPPRAPSRSRVVFAVVGNVAGALLIGALYLGWLDSLVGGLDGEASRGCDDLAGIVEDHRDAPEPETQVHPWATRSTQTTVDVALAPFLLEAVADGTYVRTHERFWNLDGHVERQHNPEAREVAVAHGFVRQVSRQWTDDDGNSVTHVVTQLSSPTNAASFNRQLARYSCRFADEVWAAPLAEHDPPGIGQRIRHDGGAVTEQVSWTRGGRRHLLDVHHQAGDPDRELLERLVSRAHPLDDGSDILTEAGESDDA